MANSEKINKVRRLLGLGEFAGLKETKQAYRKKAFWYLPDKRGNQILSRECKFGMLTCSSHCAEPKP